LFVKTAKEIPLTDFTIHCEDPSLFLDANASLWYKGPFIPDSQIELSFDENAIQLEYHDLSIVIDVSLASTEDNKVTKVKVPL